MAKRGSRVHTALGAKTVITIVILFVAMVAGAFAYRNLFIKSQTQSSLGVLVKACEGGKIRDYHNTIGVKSIEDIKYNYDDFFRVYRLYFGNYTVYMSNIEGEDWTPEALQKYINGIGVTFERVDDKVIFYYLGSEIATDKW